MLEIDRFSLNFRRIPSQRNARVQCKIYAPALRRFRTISTCTLAREVPGIENLLGPRDFFFPSHPFPNYSLSFLLTYHPHPPPLSLTPSLRDFITKCNWWNKPSFSLLYFLYSVYLPQRVLLDFPLLLLPCHFYFLCCDIATTGYRK